MKNNMLKISAFFARFLQFMAITLSIILIALMIAWPFNLDVFDNFSFVNDGSIFKFETSPSNDGILLRTYSSGYFYFLAIKALIMTGILFLILRQAIRVITSISTFETFRHENSEAFRQMGKLFIVWFIIAIPGIRELEETLQISAVIHSRYIIYALICFVLGEIFSEGNKLMEENNLTI